MARQNPDDVKKEIDQQEDENYGDETISGTNPVSGETTDVDDMMTSVVGSDFEEEEELDIADQVTDDEKEIRSGAINDYEEEEEVDTSIPQDFDDLEEEPTVPGPLTGTDNDELEKEMEKAVTEPSDFIDENDEEDAQP